MVRSNTKHKNSQAKTKTRKATDSLKKLKSDKKTVKENGRRPGTQPSWNAIQAAVLDNEMFDFARLLIKKKFKGGSRNVPLTKELTVNEYMDARVDALFGQATFFSAVPDGLDLPEFRDVSTNSIDLVFVDWVALV
jgi:hypothetical protein